MRFSSPLGTAQAAQHNVNHLCLMYLLITHTPGSMSTARPRPGINTRAPSSRQALNHVSLNPNMLAIFTCSTTNWPIQQCLLRSAVDRHVNTAVNVTCSQQNNSHCISVIMLRLATSCLLKIAQLNCSCPPWLPANLFMKSQPHFRHQNSTYIRIKCS